MNKQFLKRLTEAHSWLGLIISGVLFVIFFAGSISLFRAEIMQWSMQPHFELPQGKPLALSQIMEKAIDGVAFDAKEHLTIILPDHELPYYQVYVDVIHQPGEKDYVSYLIDPVSGEKVAHVEDFSLARFIYDLHIDLNIPAGKYVIGFVTLFFFFALVSGIFIHARKLFASFFKYRHDSNERSKLLDMHNVIGVMSVPFTLMYAISGLIFNLVIIYQIAIALALYGGDQQALLDDAGFKAVAVEWQASPWQSPPIDALLASTEQKYGVKPRMARVYNYGDKSAAIQFLGVKATSLTEKYDVAFTLHHTSVIFINDQQNPNTLVTGLYVLSKLHFGNFANIDLRIIYFLLGMGVCTLIVSGNLLWIEKRKKQREQSIYTLKFITNFTLWSTGGVVIATAVAFVAERLIPLSVGDRAQLMIYAFIATLGLVALMLCFNRQKMPFLAHLLKISSALLLLTIALDWLFYADAILTLTQQQVYNVIGTECGLLLMSLLLGVCGIKLARASQPSTPVRIEQANTVHT